MGRLVVLSTLASLMMTATCAETKYLGKSSRLSSDDYRHVTAIVEPAQTRESINFLRGLKEVCVTLPKGDVQDTCTAGIDNRLSSGFGTGFVIVTKDVDGAHAFIFTNKHVVQGATSARIRFDDGRQHAGLKVLWADPTYDVAVLQDEAIDRELTWGLVPASAEPQERDTVVAVGFPAVGDSPSFQVTDGKISNRSFEEPQDPGKAVYLQHTAPIDPGSSGGPLLDESGHLIGINTAKINNRENFGMAVPVKVLKSVLDRAETVRRGIKSPAWNEQTLRATCEKLAGYMSMTDAERSASLGDLISEQLVIRKGIESFEFMVQNLDQETRQKLVFLFVLDPMQGLQVATLMRIRVETTALREAYGVEFEKINPADLPLGADTNVVGTSFLFGKARREITWIMEQGQWRLADFQFATSAE